MHVNRFFIYLLFIVPLAFQSAHGQVEVADKTTENISVQQSDWRIDNVMKQATELFEAYDKEDLDRFVVLSHPKIYENEESQKFLTAWRYAIEIKSIRGEPLPSTIEAPNELFEINKQLFAVVPYKLNSIGNAGKDKSVWFGSMVGISDDGGKSWKFAKGAAFNEAFPDVAGMFLIPNPMEKHFVNGIEQ